jgi:hypothetical protein
MNVKLSYNVGFSAVVVDGTRIFPNSYKLKIDMLTLTENSTHQNVAIQRILIFIKEVLNNSVFIHANNLNAKKIANLAKESRVIIFPEEPHDQIVALILFHKLHAIVEGRFEIDQIQISSNISPDLQYSIEDFENFEYDESKIEVPWWQRSDPSTTDDPKRLKFSSSWADINLEWEAKKEDDLDVEFVLELDNEDLDKPDVVVLDGGEDEEETN